MTFSATAVRAALAFLPLLAVLPAARAQTNQQSEIQALRARIEQLDQQLRILERKEELQDEANAAAASAAGRVTASANNFSLTSADTAHSLRLRSLIQADSRWFQGDEITNNDAFLIRRARLIFEGTFNRLYQYQLVSDFGGSSGNGALTLVDANINMALKPFFQVRFGRFREPVGLEQLQSDAVANFTERSVVSQFAPNRDVGVQIGGDLLANRVNYAVGVFNGVGDGSSNANNAENNNEKDYAGRLFFTPFRNSDGHPALRGLGFGVGASVGKQNGAAGGLTGGYRTDGQQTFYSYRATTVAQGRTYRLSPQANFYRGSLGWQGEYILTSAEVVNGALAQRLKHHAWQTSAGYVLTGEDAAYTGVVPRSNFDLAANTWGAFEVVGRVSNADLDDRSFSGGAGSLANPANSATQARAFGVGLNWYLNRATRASVNYFNTDFTLAPGAAPAANAVVRDNEQALTTRFQISF